MVTDGSSLCADFAFWGMEILHAFEVRDPGTPTKLKVRAAQQIDTAMQNNSKWIRSQRESTLVRGTDSNLKIAS